MSLPLGTRVRVTSLDDTLRDTGEGPLLGTITAFKRDDPDYRFVRLARAVVCRTSSGKEVGIRIVGGGTDALRDSLEVVAEPGG